MIGDWNELFIIIVSLIFGNIIGYYVGYRRGKKESISLGLNDGKE